MPNPSTFVRLHSKLEQITWVHLGITPPPSTRILHPTRSTGPVVGSPEDRLNLYGLPRRTIQQPLSGMPVGPRYDMCIAVESGRCAGMGQTRRQSWQGVTDVEHLRSHELAQVVKAKVGQVRVPPGLDESLGHEAAEPSRFDPRT